MNKVISSEKVKRIWRNIRFFILNNPCHIRTDPPPCNYCGSTTKPRIGLGKFCICGDCQKRVFDNIIRGKP